MILIFLLKHQYSQQNLIIDSSVIDNRVVLVSFLLFVVNGIVSFINDDVNEGVRVEPDAFEEMFAEADVTGHGKIAFPEFMSMMSRRMKQVIFFLFCQICFLFFCFLSSRSFSFLSCFVSFLCFFSLFLFFASSFLCFFVSLFLRLFVYSFLCFFISALQSNKLVHLL
jgi:hypothetical protein